MALPLDMDIHIRLHEEADGELQARLAEAQNRYSQDRTAENRIAYKAALRQFTDWVLRGEPPETPAK